MKLFYCAAISVDYEPSGHVIAGSEEEAKRIFNDELVKEDVWHGGFISADEVELDGYEIIIKKKTR